MTAVSSRKRMRSGWLAWIAFFCFLLGLSPILRYTQVSRSIPAIAAGVGSAQRSTVTARPEDGEAACTGGAVENHLLNRCGKRNHDSEQN